MSQHTTTTDPLLERYVAAVAARLPADQRRDVADELRATVLDEAEGRGVPVRTVVTELGDPALLARGYAPARHLVAPEHYDTWRGLVVTITAVAAPVTVLATLVARVWAEDPYPQAVLGAVWTGVTVAVHVAFWVTLTFWVLERSGTSLDDGGREWTPDDLPEPPRDRTLGLRELVAGVGFLVLVLAWLPWQHLRSPVRDDSGDRVPLLDPALWSSGWLWTFAALLVVAVVVEVVKYAVGHWTLAVTALAVAADVAMAAYLIALTGARQVVNPELASATAATSADRAVLVAAVVVGGLGVAEAVRGHLRHRRVS